MLLTSAAAHAHAPAPEHALGAPSYAASLVSRSRSRSRAAADDDAAAAAAASAEPLDADLYYINLQRRPDRNAALLRQLDRVGYDRAHVHRINATAHADGAAGCLLSHVAALEAVVARAAAAAAAAAAAGRLRSCSRTTSSGPTRRWRASGCAPPSRCRPTGR